ncbi:MAG: Wzt carbohydrate-binding domain-containing protein, partial [Candidatus Omnitrophica bacterium]|nr:Wzt carbohydrate-binding domain-containing protein [Candidatus Omnitrophota bacterium]
MKIMWPLVLGRKNLFQKVVPSAEVVKKTKRWATDIEEWGKREGTKEATIQRLEIYNRLGQKVTKVRGGQPVRIRVWFRVHESIKDFHFGIAIFREDGVYCYGPNTQFDGIRFKKMTPGEGIFELRITKWLFSRGLYFLSAAIWDAKETLAYDYHKCRYKLEGEGTPSQGALVNLVSEWKTDSARQSLGIPALDSLIDKWGGALQGTRLRIDSLSTLNRYNHKETTFVTGREMKIKIEVTAEARQGDACGPYMLWVGLYRADGIYCHGSTKAILPGTRTEIVSYPQLVLLPGEYRVSAGIWDKDTPQCTTYSHGIQTFHMVSEKCD